MTKEGFTKLTGMNPTDEEFEIINGLCTVLTELSRAFSKIVTKEDCKELSLKNYVPLSEEKVCKIYGKGKDRNFVLLGGYIYLYLVGLSPRRSDDSFESFERELLVTNRMLERDYKLSLDDRRMLLEKAKAAAQEYNGK